MLEIERKFLVSSTAYRDAARSRTEIVQGFLCTDPERTIRVRRSGDRAWITIKGRTRDSGTTRPEWEYPIPVAEAEELLGLCPEPPIRKVRYEVAEGAHLFEVDEFLEANLGLTLAEVELEDVSEAFPRPDWLGEEVTGNPAYYNSQLSIKPFGTWND
ncbi:CYTH domain-containing protein [Robiginitalea sp. SC105]|uniref:CYTH domain-containing protein n=1 Tax=Robiginitalea sp. SC105 TaxID=2762332 RepID=UPI001639550C|nr:CYTH domain-containing protein [Robiginitalea sp. SC105]MBC2838058.1 CYTH domain-containing protein [Robiginitalea sp. SC105]